MYTFRITTNGTMQRYKTGLYGSYKSLNATMQQLQTHRKFNSYAEDPAAASRAFLLRRSMWRADDQLSNTDVLISRHEIAFTAIDQIVDGSLENPGLDSVASILSAMTGTVGSGRSAIGQQVTETADSILSVMNSAKYGEDFIFSGADGLTLPFEWKDKADGTKALYYRGVDVSQPVPEKTEKDFIDSNGVLDTAAFDAYKAEYETNNPGFLYDNAVKLKGMSEEHTYVDIGLGFKEDANGKIIPSSAYDSSIQGMDILGYGVDEDGDSKNVAVLMMELGQIYSRCDPDNGAYASSDDEARAAVLAPKVMDAIGRTSQEHVRIDANAAYLRANKEQLDITKNTLNEQLVEVEDADPAAVIMDMAYAQYCYNAALRIGNDILSQSLLDYMR